MRWVNIAIALSSLSLLAKASVPPTHAAAEFETTSNVVYSVHTDSSTSVTHNIVLTNRLPDIYATSYSITVGSTRIRNAWARDGIGFITPTLTQESNTTTISVNFREKSVGLGQELSFSLGYEDQDVAQRVGRIWEVNVPQPEDINDFISYDVVLIVPSEFSDPVQMVPEPQSHSRQQDVNVFEFSKDALRGQGMTAIFGDRQVFSFDIRYSIHNPSPFSKELKIALPPDTSYQRISYESITPAPTSVETDPDGNWMARIRVEGNQTTEVHAKGEAVIYLRPQKLPEQGTPLETYIGSEQPWPVEEPKIANLAQQLKTPENIYKYVVDTLSYNYERVQAGNTRLGAIGALENPDQAICMEFTDLFIALARASGIPARELNGFAFTQNSSLRPLSLKQDILHAWPEYFDRERNLWIPVDPTWGNTTQGIDYFSRFDLNHFVFAIHGSDPFLPYPAGFYKLQDTQGKDILVEPSESDPIMKPAFKVILSYSAPQVFDRSQEARLRFINVGSSAVYEPQVSLKSQGFAILSPGEQKFNAILPYTSLEVPVKMKGDQAFRTSQGRLTVTIDDLRYETEIELFPIVAYTTTPILSLVLGAGLAAGTIRTGRLLFSLKKR